MELKGIKGIGNKTLDVLNSLGINNSDELLNYFPKKYRLYCVNNNITEAGAYTLRIKIEGNPYFMPFKKDVFTIIFYSKVNDVKIKFLMFGKAYLRGLIVNGKELVVYGRYNSTTKSFSVVKFFSDTFNEYVEIDYMVKNVTNYTFTRAIKAVYACNPSFKETLPLELVKRYKLLPIESYLYYSHMASNKNEYFQVMRRRKYEEFFWFQIALNILAYRRRNTFKAKRRIDDKLILEYSKSLSFKLTVDQKKAIEIVYYDLISNVSMNRLIQGDVGCGKTIVALYAALMMVSSKYQVAVMVPTEILANQEMTYFKSELSSLGINVELLTSSTPKKEKKLILEKLLDGSIDIIVGTHSLIEDDICFKNLGLVIIDEQHKFGVNQRKKLLDKYKNVDSLYLTATPIPRTLGLTNFGDLDITSIESMPSGRIPIMTRIVDYGKIDRMFSFLNERIANNEQIYVVVPHVLESEYDVIDVDTCYKMFSEKIKGRIGITHGKLKNKDKEESMRAFKNHELDVLISTTVIEVGVNVVNATVMIIMDAHMFGLAQMHQLRGRVGRGDKKSYCFLVSDDVKNERLLTMQRTNNGFEISQMDYNIRGSGDYLGYNQSGDAGLLYSSITQDDKIWNCSKKDAMEYIDLFMECKVKSKKFDELYNESRLNIGTDN